MKLQLSAEAVLISDVWTSSDGTWKLPYKVIEAMATTVENLVFAWKLMDLPVQDLIHLADYCNFRELHRVLTTRGGSSSLQDTQYEHLNTLVQMPVGDLQEAATYKASELTEFLKTYTVEVATQIKDNVKAIQKTISQFDGVKAKVFIDTLQQLNHRTGAIGVAKPVLHTANETNLVLLDVSGSMSEAVVTRIVESVVALSRDINAWLGIVSNHAYVWKPNTATVEEVLKQAEYGGTNYQALLPFFEQMSDSNTSIDNVVVFADYDGVEEFKDDIRRIPRLNIGTLWDFSTVSSSTFLGEALATRAQEARKIMIAR